MWYLGTSGQQYYVDTRNRVWRYWPDDDLCGRVSYDADVVRGLCKPSSGPVESALRMERAE